MRNQQKRRKEKRRQPSKTPSFFLHQNATNDQIWTKQIS